MTRIAQVIRRATAGQWPSSRNLARLAAPAVAVLLFLTLVLVAGPEPSTVSSSVTTPWDDAGPDLVLDYRFYTPTGCAAGATPDCIDPHEGWSDLSYRNVGTQDATGVVVTVTLTISPAGCGIGTSLNQGGCQWDGANQRLICPIIVGDLAVGQAGGVPTYWMSWCDPTPGGTAQITTNITVTDDGAHGPELTPDDNNYRSVMTFTYETQLYLQQTSPIALALPGQVIAHDLVVGSWSTQAVLGAVITETVPAYTTFNPVQSAPGWQCAPDYAAGSICTLAPAYDPWGGQYGGLGYGMTLNPIRFAVTVNDTLPDGVEAIINTAQVGDSGYGGPDTVPEDNISTIVTPIHVPTGIAVLDFAATRNPMGVALTWATLGETNELGYNIHRSTTPDQPDVQVNAELLPALRDPAGATYEFTDKGSRAERSVFYWLEVVSELEKTWVGPAEASWRARLFLPLVVRSD